MTARLVARIGLAALIVALATGPMAAAIGPLAAGVGPGAGTFGPMAAASGAAQRAPSAAVDGLPAPAAALSGTAQDGSVADPDAWIPDSTLLAADPEVAATDVRTLVPARRLTKRPFRGVVLVSVGSSVVCTGFVIAPRKVVTAAHCLTRDAARGNFRFRDGLPQNVRLYRAYSLAAGGSPYASCGISRAWAHPKFIRRDSSDSRYGSHAHDSAVLTTERGCSYPRNAVMRMWATTDSGDALRSGRTLKLGGYPADPRFDDMNGLNLWRTRGRAQPNGGDARILFTTGFVAQGMSGGPVWRSFGKDSPCGRAQCVVAVLTECAVSSSGLCRLGDSTRRAVRITPNVKRIIRKR